MAQQGPVVGSPNKSQLSKVKPKHGAPRGRVGRLIENEFKSLTKDPVAGIKVEYTKDKANAWTVWVDGPENSPYNGGKFEISVLFQDFPLKPPKMTMITPIYHLNINKVGTICLEVLTSGWKGQNKNGNGKNKKGGEKMRGVFMDLLKMMQDPSCEDPLVAELAVLYTKNKEKYIENAQKCTEIYAMNNNNNNKDDQTKSEPSKTLDMKLFDNDPTTKNNKDTDNNNSNNNNDNDNDNDNDKKGNNNKVNTNDSNNNDDNPNANDKNDNSKDKNDCKEEKENENGNENENEKDSNKNNDESNQTHPTTSSN